MHTIAVAFAQAMGEYAGTAAGGAGGVAGPVQMPEVSLTAWLFIGGVLVGAYLFTRLS